VVATVAATSAPRSTRDFLRTPWAFGASADAVGALVLTNTTTKRASDAIAIASVSAVLGGRWDATTLLSGELPARGDADCPAAGTVNAPRAVAIDGARIAVAEVADVCGVTESPDRIVVRDGDATTVIPTGDPVDALDLAGDHVAWSVQGGGVHVASVRTGAIELALPRTRRLQRVDDLAVDGDGTLALVHTAAGSAPRLGIAQPGAERLKVLAGGVAERGVAIADGWVLYEQWLRGDRSRLRLRHVSGARPRSLASFGPGHRRVGDIDLDDTRATWAIGGRSPRIVLRTL
jgi:hypothetical protein